MFGLNSHVSGVTSRIYTLIWSKDNSYNIKTTSAWEEELGQKFDDGYWDTHYHVMC